MTEETKKRRTWYRYLDHPMDDEAFDTKRAINQPEGYFATKEEAYNFVNPPASANIGRECEDSVCPCHVDPIRTIILGNSAKPLPIVVGHKGPEIFTANPPILLSSDLREVEARIASLTKEQIIDVQQKVEARIRKSRRVASVDALGLPYGIGKTKIDSEVATKNIRRTACMSNFAKMYDAGKTGEKVKKTVAGTVWFNKHGQAYEIGEPKEHGIGHRIPIKNEQMGGDGFVTVTPRTMYFPDWMPGVDKHMIRPFIVSVMSCLDYNEAARK